MKTILRRFKVINFRSIEESDWITVGDNTCLVGTNEAGKSNLLIALWKLNPASGETIRPLADYPRHLYSKFKPGGHEQDVFIKADIELDYETQEHIANELSCDIEQVKLALIERRYDGQYQIKLPYTKIESYSRARLISILDKFEATLKQSDIFNKETVSLKEQILKLLKDQSPSADKLSLYKDDISYVISQVNDFISSQLGKKQNLPQLFGSELITPLEKLIDAFNGRELETTSEIRQLILNKLPKFVYYSDYGNLDSEIYLPRVIEDLERDDLTESARAKARTLDVLFKYVNLSPKEIYELGNDRKIVVKTIDQYSRVLGTQEENLSPEEVAEWAEKKKERGVLLKSASSELTKSFKQWWLQGNYIFSFEADGSHFRINVSDELRPESIELEGRSRGLQWFFSFFLVFLVETKEDHANSILLLDEPGLSLHPMAQYDLSKFFRKLTEENQLLYTSHSPFLVDMDNLANVKAVYVDSETGRTKVSSNLRHNEVDAEKSIYPVHAALGLTVSDTLLLGCLPVLVEGPSDQIYLSMIKRYLVGKGLLRDSRELVFIPTGGVKGMGPVTKLVSSRDHKLPFVLLDSDGPGKDYLKQLHNGSYREQKERVLDVAKFLGNNAYEIEDLLPPKGLSDIVDRIYKSKDDFEDSFISGMPIIDQIEKWASENKITLEKGWKVDLSREAINRFDKIMKEVPEELEKVWVQIFNTFLEKQ